LKTDKKKLGTDLKQRVKEIDTLRAKFDSLYKKYSELSDMNQKGEQLLTGQVRDLNME